MTLICDNQVTLHITSNLAIHERTTPSDVDSHFVREKMESGDIITTSFVNSNNQLVYILTKSLRGPQINYICNKLGAYDICSNLRECLK